MEVDESFLTAMEYGLPPMTGFGMGIDRLVAILTERKNLREVIFFPTLKPKK
jgi:lysyl-tRNA synthetase class 2